MEKYRLMGEIFRNGLKYNRILDIVTGLVNDRTLNRQNQKFKESQRKSLDCF